MERRTRWEDTHAQLEQQTFNLFPERWSELYKDELLAELGLPNEEGEIPLQEDDLAALDQFMEKIERGGTFSMSGGQTADVREEWGRWV